jgi:hypothetical protein
MNATEVELLIRNVIVQFGMPFTVLSVNGSPTGWNVRVRAESGDVVRFTLIGAQPVSMRAAIQEKLEAAF